ncbi:hypothetical protein [Xylophilus sp. GOD-11R]|uniref:hypothetical protein n=1 Tax=Xylophilus sp. GOD-11R TaxID=3089814 RepID=UPI00298C06B2|nr:hypothetical protein [Xylophilus sp. GOD-11R]WPB55478.1 hypothetical protein R9X41_15160 [Xylophilus sp. GOD-11R]
MTEMTQSPVQFGPDRALMGMVTLPPRKLAAPVGVLMLNMGANHRVGPRRINVKLAHVLAREGITSLRMDLGGVGDSGVGHPGDDLRQRAVADLRAAMDLLKTMLDIERFVIVGMCSGAEHAIATALADPRVVGISMFDGPSFPDLRARLHRTLRRACTAPFHPAFAGKAVRLMARLAKRGKGGQALPGFFTEGRSRQAELAWFRDAMNRLADREVALHMLFSGSLDAADRDRDHLGRLRAERFVRQVRYEFAPDLDHTVCTTRGQQLYLASVGGWVTQVARQAPAVRTRPATTAAAPQPIRTAVPHSATTGADERVPLQ